MQTHDFETTLAITADQVGYKERGLGPGLGEPVGRVGDSYFIHKED